MKPTVVSSDVFSQTALAELFCPSLSVTEFGAGVVSTAFAASKPASTRFESAISSTFCAAMEPRIVCEMLPTLVRPTSPAIRIRPSMTRSDDETTDRPPGCIASNEIVNGLSALRADDWNS